MSFSLQQLNSPRGVANGFAGRNYRRPRQESLQILMGRRQSCKDDIGAALVFETSCHLFGFLAATAPVADDNSQLWMLLSNSFGEVPQLSPTERP